MRKWAKVSSSGTTAAEGTTYARGSAVRLRSMTNRASVPIPFRGNRPPWVGFDPVGDQERHAHPVEYGLPDLPPEVVDCVVHRLVKPAARPGRNE